MNAAAQRRLTPVCVVVVAVLGLALLTLLFGAGRGVRWDAPRSTPPLPAAHNVALPSAPSLDSYAPAWLHPLFSSDRKPIVTAGGKEGVSLGDLQLTGIILTPTLRMALLGSIHDNKGDDSKQVRVREGATLPDGNWKLIQVLPRSAIFASPTGRTELKLPAGAPIDQQAPAPVPAAQAPIQMGAPAAHPPRPLPPNDTQTQRLLRLKAAILKQRARQPGNAQGAH